MKIYTKILIGMVVGVVLGVLLGPNGALLPKDAASLGGAVIVASPEDPTPVLAGRGVKEVRVRSERSGDPGWLEVEWTLDAKQVLDLGKQVTPEQRPAFTAIRPGVTSSGWMRDGGQVTRYALWGQRAVDWTEWIGRLFLALIRMVVVPLVFCSLLVGVASLGDFRKIGRIGGRTLLYFTGTTVLALVIALVLANVIQPGNFLAQADRELLLRSYEAGAAATVGNAAKARGAMDQIIGIVPTNPFAALASGEMLQVIFFALMFGIALTLLDEKRAKKVVDVADVANDAMIMLVHIAMMLAPFGVGALLFKVAGTTGLSVIVALGAYALVVVLGLLLHSGLVYGAVVTFGARLPFPGFLGAMRSALLVAFSTSSSSATLPVTKECVEQNLNVSPQVSSFVLPLGATVNMDGTALYQGVAAVFIAQIYGIDLSLGDQVTIVLSATLASVGAAGVPGAGMITLALVLTAIGVPTEGLALILGVDRLLDMLRTTTNVLGDATAATLMGRLEGNALEILSPDADAASATRGFEGRLAGGAHPVAVEPDTHIAEPGKQPTQPSVDPDPPEAT